MWPSRSSSAPKIISLTCQRRHRATKNAASFDFYNSPIECPKHFAIIFCHFSFLVFEIVSWCLVLQSRCLFEAFFNVSACLHLAKHILTTTAAEMLNELVIDYSKHSPFLNDIPLKSYDLNIQHFEKTWFHHISSTRIFTTQKGLLHTMYELWTTQEDSPPRPQA